MASIQIVSLSPHHWVVREEGGRDRHYPNQEQAEAVGRALARKRNCDLVIHPIVVAAIPIHERPRGWLRRWFGG
jgi:hypothetical protein